MSCKDVLARLDKAFAAFFRRIKSFHDRKGKHLAIPAFTDALATTPSPTRSLATARILDNGFLSFVQNGLYFS